jgi:probable rRNA maturation factor
MSRAARRCRVEWAGEEVAPAARRLAEAAVEAALARDGLTGCSLCVLVVDEAGSARLHGEHFADPTPTDVMSFPDGTDDMDDGGRRLGDLAVCAAVARTVAARRGRPADEELALYVLHGCLHLLGYDDVEPADRAEMWAVQRAVMGGLGVEIGPE